MFTFIKRIIFNKFFSWGEDLADKTKTDYDNQIITIARQDFEPIITEKGAFPRCGKKFLLDALQYSVNYAKNHKTCEWLWDWLKEIQKILNEIEL